MKLRFIGADHEVTGSCHLIEACGKNILVDCGMEQGPDLYENQEIPVSAGEIDYVLLTHAHIDHSGKMILCFETVRTFRNLRQSGETGRHSEAANLCMSHCIQWNMQKQRSSY